MRKLTNYGKRLMAGVGLILAVALVILLGVLMFTCGPRLLHISDKAFNVIVILIALPILCKLIIDMIFIIRHGRLL